MDEEIVQKLLELTDRERQILKKVCQGTLYKDIAKEFFISEATVKAHMGNIYIKLGLNYMPSSLRRKALFESYCPVLAEMEQPQVKEDEPIDPEPVPDDVIEKVEEDETAIVPYVEGKIVKIEEPKKTKREPKIGLRIILILILLCLGAFGAYHLYDMGRNYLVNAGLIPSEAVNVPTQAVAVVENPTSEPTQIEAIVAEPTQALIVPTSTEIPLTNTPEPTITSVPTNTPAPKIALPYTNNFESGLSSEWTTLTGNWVTANGKLTAVNHDGDPCMIMLDDPTWTNYKLGVDIHIPNIFSGIQPKFSIGIRAMNTQKEFLGLYADTLCNTGFALLGTGDSYTDFLLGRVEDYDVPEDVTYQIEANGNEFVMRINGRELQRLNMSGYERGGIVFGVDCTKNADCPTFDNLKIEPIN